MKKALAFLLFILSFGIAGAENDTIIHYFDDLYKLKELKIPSPYKIGTIGDVIYTCEGTTQARFYQDLEYPIGHKVIAINLPQKNDRVTTTQFNNLKKIVLYFTQSGKSKPKIELSTDSVNWGNGMTKSVYSPFSYELDTPGDYYVRIYNDSTAAISIYQTKFYLVEENCNCFTYTP